MVLNAKNTEIIDGLYPFYPLGLVLFWIVGKRFI